MRVLCVLIINLQRRNSHGLSLRLFVDIRRVRPSDNSATTCQIRFNGAFLTLKRPMKTGDRSLERCPQGRACVIETRTSR